MIDKNTPVLLLGGKENSLSVARNLGRMGIAVRVSGGANCLGMYSRFCAERLPVPVATSQPDHWKRLLLGPDRRLDRHIVLALSDAAIEFLLENREELTSRYVLDDVDPALQRDLLDKQRTLELAAEAGIDAPRHWQVTSAADVDALRGKIVFPAMVKPKQSHRFAEVFGSKLFIVENDFEELRSRAVQCFEHGVAIMITEMVPGPDDLLTSYYTYMDGAGRRLFRYTKQIIRRWPVNQGNACYHAGAWQPETAALAERLLDQLSYRGIANVEFKRDRRDGKLKLIEINTRITAAQELPVRQGIPIDLIIYLHLTGQPVPTYPFYREDLRLWYPARDFMCFLDLRRSQGMTIRQWLASVAGANNILPSFRFSDPAPMLGAAYALCRKLVNA